MSSDPKLISPLYSYQEQAVTWIFEREYSLLACPMGSGKTRVVLQALQELLQGGHIRRALVVAPLRVATMVWPLEAHKWHLPPVVAAVGPKARRRLVHEGDAPLVVTNYDVLDQDLGMIQRGGYDALVFDETTRLKAWTSQRTKAARTLRKQARWVVGLTGTPTTQGLLDLFAQVGVLDQGAAFGTSVTRFKMATHYKVDMWTWRPLPGALQASLARVPFAFLVEPDDYRLPDLIVNDLVVSLPPAVKQQYDRLEEAAVLELEGTTISATTAAAASNKLCQCADGHLYDEAGETHHVHSAKLDALDEIIESQQGRPLLVLYRFRSTLAAILKRWPQARHLDQDPETVAAWNRGEIPLLVGHPASMGHGLNLQDGGCDMVFVGLPWSLELYLQAVARLHRGGQRSHVTVHRLIARGTVDRAVARALSAKREVLDEVLAHLRRQSGTRKASAPPSLDRYECT